MTAWVSTYLNSEHDLASFDCGNEALNTWLKEQALRANEAGIARTYVWTPPDEPIVKAYYSVAPTQIQRAELTGGQAKGYSIVPAYLLARLALDRSLHDHGLGGDLLIDALETIVKAAKMGGGRLIVVDAIDDNAVAFYQHYDFQAVKGNPRRLVMKIATAQQALSLVSISATPDRGTRLISIVMEMPNGASIPLVLSAAETRSIADHLERAEGDPAEGVDLRKAIRDALGRDPFDTNE
jgi:GNAT superfamily N-acetyltransferase